MGIISAIIAVDFDGTVVDHRFESKTDLVPHAPHAVRTLKDLTNSGARLILWTMRSGSKLDEAVQWYEDNNIPLWGVQKNPEQETWSQSPKAYAQIYIDDAALGAPLIKPEGFARPCIDWLAVRKYFQMKD